MTFEDAYITSEDALEIVKAASTPRFLSELQEQVFQGSWHNHSYAKIAQNTNYPENYLTDIGSELWQLLSQKLEVKVTQLGLRKAVKQYILLRLNLAIPEDL